MQHPIRRIATPRSVSYRVGQVSDEGLTNNTENLSWLSPNQQDTVLDICSEHIEPGLPVPLISRGKRGISLIALAKQGYIHIHRYQRSRRDWISTAEGNRILDSSLVCNKVESCS
jgi:hypothetical protein